MRVRELVLQGLNASQIADITLVDRSTVKRTALEMGLTIKKGTAETPFSRIVKGLQVGQKVVVHDWHKATSAMQTIQRYGGKARSVRQKQGPIVVIKTA